MRLLTTDEREEISAEWFEFGQAVMPHFASYVSLYNRCCQESNWKTREGETLALKEMASSHRENLIRWLERRAKGIHKAAILCMSLDLDLHDGGDMAHDSIEEDLNTLYDVDPIEFLRDLPLMRKLVQLQAQEDVR